MKLHVIPAHSAPAPPVGPDPRAREAARLMLVDAREAIRTAVIATTNAGRIDPTQPFWTHRAVASIGVAAGLIQAVEGLKRVSGALIPGTTYLDGFDEARVRIADAAALLQRGDRGGALSQIAAARARLVSFDHQFAFDIEKHAPLPLR